MDSKCIILHVPHASTYIPNNIKKEMMLSEEELTNEILVMTDHFTDKLFAMEGVHMYKSPVSRLVVDMERFRNYKDEIMSSVGMGAVYELTAGGKKLRELNAKNREEILKTYFDPYHKGSEELVGRVLEEYGQCLIIDCHSFPSFPLPYEIDQSPDRPDICIGTCDFHTPQKLINIVQTRLANAYKVYVNRPFAGTFVPAKYYLSDKRVNSIMIEVNRGLYMDQSSGQKNRGFKEIKLLLSEIINGLIMAS